MSATHLCVDILCILDKGYSSHCYCFCRHFIFAVFLIRVGVGSDQFKPIDISSGSHEKSA